MQSVVKSWVAMFLAIVIAGVASCGAGSNLALENGSALTPDGSVGLPALPQDKTGTPGRSASAVETIPGSAAIEFANGEVVDTTMVLTSTETEMAWALYKVEGLQGKKVTSLTLEVLAGDIGGHYGVGVSNFSDGVWEFLQNGVLPEFEYDLSDEMSRLTSQLGNLYFVVVAAEGNVASIQQATIFSRDLEAGEVERPAIGDDLSVSEGLADKIVVQWLAVAGPTSYELWREADIEGVDEVAELLATIEVVEGQASYTYEDTAIALDTEYKYRIRGINAEGAGAFSRWESGWAGTAPVGEETEDELEITGLIEAIDETSITVEGQLFGINATTVWLGNDEELLTAADFTVGMTVEIEGDSDFQGGYIARKIKVEDEGTGVDEITLRGGIEAIDAGSITVLGTVLAITETTEWLDQNGEPMLAGEFTVGLNVEATGDADGLGGWIARKVKLEDGAGGGDMSITGLIEAIEAESLTVAAMVFATTPETQWLDELGVATDPANFLVGMNVEVSAVADGLGGFTATIVKMQDNGEQETEVIGLIEAIDETSLTVTGTVFTFNEATEWLDANNDPLTPGDFSVGLNVSVRALASGEGQWTATKVKIED